METFFPALLRKTFCFHSSLLPTVLKSTTCKLPLSIETAYRIPYSVLKGSVGTVKTVSSALEALKVLTFYQINLFSLGKKFI